MSARLPNHAAATCPRVATGRHSAMVARTDIPRSADPVIEEVVQPGDTTAAGLGTGAPPLEDTQPGLPDLPDGTHGVGLQPQGSSPLHTPPVFHSPDTVASQAIAHGEADGPGTNYLPSPTGGAYSCGLAAEQEPKHDEANASGTEHGSPERTGRPRSPTQQEASNEERDRARRRIFEDASTKTSSPSTEQKARPRVRKPLPQSSTQL